jgi:hypothetical protein
MALYRGGQCLGSAYRPIPWAVHKLGIE